MDLKPHSIEPPSASYSLLFEIQNSRWYFPALVVADELGIFPFIAKTPSTLAATAKQLSLSKRGTEALIALMASLGFLRQHDGIFIITDVTRDFLLPDSPHYRGSFLHGSRGQGLAKDIRQCVKKDQPLNHDAEEETFWQRFVAGKANPEDYENFTQDMHAISFSVAIEVARWGEFAGVKRLLDVGGGAGSYCIALAQRYPDIQCSVLELPQVCPHTETFIRNYSLEGRIDTIGMDMFSDTFPSGYDVILFSNVFHNWGPDQCAELASKSFEALPSDGRMYLSEVLMADGYDGPVNAAVDSLSMLMWGPGKQYSYRDLNTMLENSGFQKATVTEIINGVSLVIATKP